MKLAESFYTRTDVVAIAKELLGKVLVTDFEGARTSGMIVETEAYAGATDKASHAYGNRNTRRTAVMFLQGGACYVYLCYGIHHLFNVVTNIAGIPHAVLIRAVEPLQGIDVILARRHKEALHTSLTAGPGAMSMALGIRTEHSGLSLLDSQISIEDHGYKVIPTDIAVGTRVGVGYAGADALLPYRFSLAGNKYVSKGKGL